jgi:hypothetical protein
MNGFREWVEIILSLVVQKTIYYTKKFANLKCIGIANQLIVKVGMLSQYLC